MPQLDAVILCTGYTYNFEFLDLKVRDFENCICAKQAHLSCHLVAHCCMSAPPFVTADCRHASACLPVANQCELPLTQTANSLQMGHFSATAACFCCFCNLMQHHRLWASAPPSSTCLPCTNTCSQ